MKVQVSSIMNIEWQININRKYVNSNMIRNSTIFEYTLKKFLATRKVKNCLSLLIHENSNLIERMILTIIKNVLN